MYQYLTGAASWFMLTMITEVFGVRGEAGDLILYPKLLACQFDENAAASITIPFAGKNLLLFIEIKTAKTLELILLILLHVMGVNLQ